MDMLKGMRAKLSDVLDVNNEITVLIAVSGGSVYDFSCFGVDAAEKLSDERYMIFYNQTASPSGEIVYTPVSSGAEFRIRLTALPASIEKLVFTASIDGAGTMNAISSHTATISQNGKALINLSLKGSDFHDEKAIISIELYKKSGIWRISAVASGFNGGLSDLLRKFGGIQAAPQNSAPQQNYSAPQQQNTYSQPAPPPQPPKPEKISLKKGQKISLAKNNNNSIIIENGWTAQGKDYDLKALVRYRNGLLIYVGAANSDEVLSTPEGAVCHGGDVKLPGELEHIEIKWHPDIASVAVSSYSALENGTGSFHRYGVFVRIKNGNQIIEIPAADTSANDKSYTLCFGEIIYGTQPGSLDVAALEMYSRPGSEHRIGYSGSQVVMDIGPEGKKK